METYPAMKKWCTTMLFVWCIFRWGVRCNLRPPVAPIVWRRRPSRAGEQLRLSYGPSRWWYHWRFFCWRIENRIYEASGLPALWKQNTYPSYYEKETNKDSAKR